MANSVAVTIGLCSLYISISAALINFNKYMMHEDRFPFAVALTTAHVAVTFVSCALLYLVAPSLYPSMHQAIEKRASLVRLFAPVAVLFILGVVCSNQAYLYCSVAFLQFMKEWNVALVFLFSCIAGSQTADRVKTAVILWIVVSACTAVTGDMRFSHLGFLIQAVSQLGETTRIVLQEKLLGGEVKLDPLTYQVFVAPPTLFLLAIVNYFAWDPRIIPALQAWWPYIAANASCAVLLNVTIAVLIGSAGGVAFVLSGVVKDVVIVCASLYLAGKSLNVQQFFGFAAALLGILFWGMLKSQPKNVVVQGFTRLLKSEGQCESEGSALLPGPGGRDGQRKA